MKFYNLKIKLTKLQYLFPILFICLFYPLMSKANVSLVKGQNSKFRLTQETIVIKYSQNDIANENESLSLELDDIDITDMIDIQLNRISYKPVQGLNPGIHSLKLLINTNEGDIKELGAWKFNVRQSASFKQYGATANVELSDNYRVTEKNLFEPLPTRNLVQGSSQFSYSADTGNWHTQGQFDLIYNSSNDGQFGARKLDNGEFLFSAGNQLADIQIGHQTIGERDLVMDNFHRRGVSFGANLNSLKTRISGFSLSSEDVIGFKRGLAISDSNQRVDGVNFSFNPMDDSSLILHGTWLTGKKKDEGGFTGSIDDIDIGVSDGNAQSLSITSELLETRLQISAEYGKTDFNPDSADTTTAKNDNAYNVRINYTDTTDSGISWNMGIETSRVGTYYKSLGNEGLGADNKTDQAMFGVQWETVGIQGNIQKQYDNVRHLAEIPRTQAKIKNLAVNWSPTIETMDKWYGSPSFDASYSKQDQNQTLLATGSLLPDTDSTLDNWQVSSTFNYETGSWGVSYGYNGFEDFTGIQNDTDSTSIGLNGTISFLEQKLTLAPTVQFDSAKDLDSGITSDSVSYGLQSTFILLENTLDGSVLVNFNKNRITDNSINNNASSSALTLNWHALEAKPNRLGIDVGLNAQYNDTKDKIFITNSIGTYQVFLSISIVFPGQIGVIQ